MPQLRAGVVGLGEVAQLIHLPILAGMSNRFALTAICDISPKLLADIGARYNIPPSARYLDFHEIAKRTDLDVIFVLNSDEYHTDTAIAAMRGGKHVLIEKPMCLTLPEAEQLMHERDAAGVKLMVGYMRRYAPAFEEAVRHVRQLDRINYVRVRDIIGHNHQFIDQIQTVIKPDDYPPDAGSDRRQRAARMVTEAIGSASPELANRYRLLCGLNSHDLSAMREMVGMPQRVLSATTWNGSDFLLATMDFGDFRAVLETGVDRQVRFDAQIEVYGEHTSVRIEYDTPYIRHLPTRAFVSTSEGDFLTRQELLPTYTDPYTCELEAFHSAILTNGDIKTSAEDFTDDLRLFRWIIDALRAA